MLPIQRLQPDTFRSLDGSCADKRAPCPVEDDRTTSPRLPCPHVFKERSARRPLHGVVRRAELPRRPEWSAAGTMDILPAVYSRSCPLTGGECHQELFPPVVGTSCRTPSKPGWHRRDMSGARTGRMSKDLFLSRTANSNNASILLLHCVHRSDRRPRRLIDSGQFMLHLERPKWRH